MNHPGDQEVERAREWADRRAKEFGCAHVYLLGDERTTNVLTGLVEECHCRPVDAPKMLTAYSSSRDAERLEWRCFYCEFVTSNRAEAEAHFGDRDDAEEFKPICKWWAKMDDTERKHEFQDVVQQLHEAQSGVGDAEQKLLVAELAGALEELSAIAEAAPELNMENYNEDEVSNLNAAMIETTLKLRDVMARAKETM